MKPIWALLCGLGCGPWVAVALANPAPAPVPAAVLATADEAPAWSDEPPLLSNLIEQGWQAQGQSRWSEAAARYCSAARLGSAEAQYRLGRLYLQSPLAAEQAQGLTLLGGAAQRGHEKAQAMMNGQPPAAEAWPDCLITGQAPQLAMLPPVPAEPEAVPHEVVERYVLSLPQDKRRHAQLIQRLAPRFEVDARLALAIARAESNFDPAALSPKNAMGLMQLIPDTASRFGVRNAFDPEQNVRGGLAYLRWLLQRFQGDVALASAAYNAGEGAVDRHGGVPPYAETQQYVQRILHFYRAPRHRAPGAM